MKKIAVLVCFIFLSACNSKITPSIGFTFQLPKDWIIKQITDSKVILNAPVPTGYAIVPTDITLFHFSKEAGEKLEDIIAQKQTDFPHSSFAGECTSSIQFPQSTLHKCGRWTEDYFLVNPMGTKIVAIFLGQDPFLSPEQFANLISFDLAKYTSTKPAPISSTSLPQETWQQFHDTSIHVSLLSPPGFTVTGKQFEPNVWMVEVRDKEAVGQPGITIYMNDPGMDFPFPERAYKAEETGEGRLILHEVPQPDEPSSFAKADNFYIISGPASRNGNDYFFTFNGGKAYDEVFKKMVESIVIEK